MSHARIRPWGDRDVDDRPVAADPDTPEHLPIRPLSFRELVDLPFVVIAAHIRPLVGLIGPAFAIAVAAVAGITAAGSAATRGSDAGTAWTAVLSTLALAWLLRWYVRGVTVPAGLASVHRQPIGGRAALRHLVGEAGPLLRYRAVATLLAVAVLAVGAILLITLPPAVVLLGWLRARRCLATPVRAEESLTARDARARARVLTSGAEWRLTGAWLCLRCVLVALVVPLLGGTLAVAELSGTHRWATIVLATATVLLFTAFAEVVESAADVVGYIDSRCRREGADIRIPAAETPRGAAA